MKISYKQLKKVIKENVKKHLEEETIPGGVEFPSLDHIYRRFFFPMPKEPMLLTRRIKEALAAAERLGTRKVKGESNPPPSVN
jgi:hypothetical protein